jgi:hypothetical protein
MKRDTLKYIGLGLIAVILVFANTMMVYKTFFAKNRIDFNIKNHVITTNQQIKYYVDSLFVNNNKDTIKINNDEIESNKRIIMEKDIILGFVYIIYEQINCPSCSDVNYLLVLDKEYRILNFVFLRNIVEGYKIFPIEEFKKFTNTLIGKNLLTNTFSEMNIPTDPLKYSIYFKRSILSVQNQARLFNEK